MPVDPTERTDIYFKSKGEAQRAQARFQAWNGRQEDRNLIQGFQTHLFAKGTKAGRVAKATGILQRICDAASQPISEWTARDLEAAIARVNQNPAWTEATKRDYRRILKQILLWYEDDDHRLQDGAIRRDEARKLYRYVRQHVKTTYRAKSLDYATIITDDDARQLILNGCRTPIERAFVAVLHETGCRIGEMLGQRIRDIERKDRHAIIRVDGKTGERRVPVVQSIPHLESWLQLHPYRTNPNALLWISQHNRWNGQPLRYIGSSQLLERVFKIAGITKQSNPHWFRHSRATILAPRYSESILCKIMGWSIGSKQVRTYVHLGARQVEDEFLKEHGLAPTEQKLSAVTFCVCGATNDGAARYCFKCGNALSVATLIEDEGKKHDAIEEATQLLVHIMSTPELRQRFEAYQKNGGTKP